MSLETVKTPNMTAGFGMNRKIQLEWTFPWSVSLYLLYWSFLWMEVRCSELWNSIFSSPFIKDAPVFPVLKEATKEALKLLSSVFRELNGSVYGRQVAISPSHVSQLGTWLWKINCWNAPVCTSVPWCWLTMKSNMALQALCNMMQHNLNSQHSAC